MKHQTLITKLLSSKNLSVDEEHENQGQSLQNMVDSHQDTTKLIQSILGKIQTYFPGSLTSEDCLEKVSKVIEARGLDDDNTLFAQSVCPDEINHEEGDITNLFTEYLGEVFHMGGLGGIPFTGKTGFAAYSHHVPDGGHCFILMAPHIGMDSNIDLGKYDREGQNASGAACGAAIGALCHCEANKPMPDMLNGENDYQMSFIIHKVNEAKEAILEKAGGDPRKKQALLAHHMHEVAMTMLEKIVTLDFGGPTSTLTILTGIQINMPDPMDDYFQPLSFVMKDKTLGDIDLFEETFGVVSPRKPVLEPKLSLPFCSPITPKPTVQEVEPESPRPMKQVVVQPESPRPMKQVVVQPMHQSTSRPIKTVNSVLSLHTVATADISETSDYQVGGEIEGEIEC